MDRTLSLLVKFAALDKLTGPLKAMSGGARRAARDMVATKKEITGLESAAGKVAGLKALGAQVDKTFEEIDAGRRRIRALNAAIASGDGPLGTFKRQLAQAETRVEQLSKKSTDQTERMSRLRTELRGAGVDVGHLAREEERLSQALGDANRRMEQQQRRSERAAAAQRRITRAGEIGSKIRNGGAASLAGGLAMGGTGVALASKARGFQSIMVDIAQKADLSQRDTARMAANLLKTAPAVAQLPKDLAAGVDTLAGLGLDPKQAATIIKPLGRAATAYKAEMTDLSNATYSSLDNLKVPVAQTARTLDVMAAAGKAGAFEMKDMAAEFPALTAAAAGLGQKGVGAVADLAAVLQIARKGAGDSSTAANNVLNLLNKINAEDTAKNFKKLGVDLPASLKRAYAQGKTPLEAIIELTRKATGGDTSKIGRLFEDAQIQAALRPMLANTELYRKIRSDALAATGTVERDFQDRMANDGEARQAKFNAQLERMQIVLGERVLPILNTALERFGGMADRVTDWADRNPVLVRGLTMFAAILATTLTVLGAVGIAFGTALPWIVRGAGIMGRFGGALGWIARGAWAAAAAIGAFVGLPAIAVAAIAAGLALAGIALYRHWDKIKALFQNAPALFTGFGKAIMSGLVAGFRMMFPTVSSVLGSVLQLAGVGTGKPASTVRPTVRPVTPARAGGGGSPVTIHVNQRPGESGEALAHRVAGHVADGKRASARRDRSSYQDRD